MRLWRAAAACLLLLATAPSFGQTNIFPGLSRALRSLPTRDARELPEPKPRGEETFKVRGARTARTRGDVTVLEGDVWASYKGYELRGDRVTFDRVSEIGTLEGNAKLDGDSETVTGESITVDFKQRTFAFTNSRARLEPDAVQKRTTGEIYLRGDGGGGRQRDFTVRDGSFTTCDLEHPHYALDAEGIRILPGRRAELRDVRLSVLGKTVIGIPYLVVPLEQRSERYLPEVGQSPDEGYYVKTRFGSPLPGESYLDYRVDLMSKLGAGLGVDYNYKAAGLDGVLTAYQLTGSRKSTVVTSRHSQKIWDGQLSVNGAFQRENYLTSPNSTLWNVLAQYATPFLGGNSRLGYTLTRSESTGFKSVSQSTSINDDRRIGPLNQHLDLTLTQYDSQYSGGNLSKSERIDLRYTALAPMRSLDADLLYQRAIPVSSSQDFFAPTDTTPMLTLRSDAGRLIDSRWGRVWPFTFAASIGELVDASSRDRVTRINFETGLRRRLAVPRGRSEANLGVQFRQGLYSDDTAQYVIAGDGDWRYGFARDSGLRVSYRYLRPFGFTPLAIDSTGRSDAFNFSLDYRASKAVLLSGQTGYDLLSADRGVVPWQFVYLRGRWNTGNKLDAGVQLSYDTFRQVWSNLRFDTNLDWGGTRFVMAARYDAQRSTWAGLSAQIDGLRLGKIGANILVDYNGYTSRFEAQHYQLTYDLHCTEAVLEVIDNSVGFRSGRTVAFFFRIKALPMQDLFGFGRRGQVVGGGFGFGN
ncbi:MAG: LPS-assembly protein LptD [Fimbriimonadaceae bacterium]|nr:LPS-assembly protein LptD [Fimbriimonadaceae bacterium]QYK57024.1 MAG: LPS-assembly protein LptD [Fimbriimonadaceae bacterium]